MRNFLSNSRITIKKNLNVSRENANWRMEAIRDLKGKRKAGASSLTGMGCDKPEYTYWDQIAPKRKPSHQPLN